MTMKLKVTQIYDAYTYDELNEAAQQRVREWFSQQEGVCCEAASAALTCAAWEFAEVGIMVDFDNAAYDLSLHNEWPWLTVPFEIDMDVMLASTKTEGDVAQIAAKFHDGVLAVTNPAGWHIPFVVNNDERTVRPDEKRTRDMFHAYFRNNERARFEIHKAMRIVTAEVIDLILSRMVSVHEEVGSDQFVRQECIDRGLLFTESGEWIYIGDKASVEEV